MQIEEVEVILGHSLCGHLGFFLTSGGAHHDSKEEHKNKGAGAVGNVGIVWSVEDRDNQHHIQADQYPQSLG